MEPTKHGFHIGGIDGRAVGNLFNKVFETDSSQINGLGNVNGFALLRADIELASGNFVLELGHNYICL